MEQSSISSPTVRLCGVFQQAIVYKMNAIDMDDLSNDAKTIIAYVQFEFDKMKTELTATVNSKNLEIENLKGEVKSLNDKVAKLENLVDESDAYERRDTLIFSGSAVPEATTNENCGAIIQDLVKNELNYVISPNDISISHRLGKKPVTQGPDKRSIVVKFCRREIKNGVYAARKNQTRQNRIYINESLTPTRQTIYHTLRRIKRLNPELVNGFSTYDGRVYAYTKNTSPSASSTRDMRHLINNMEMLKKFCHDYLKKPLTTFLESFAQ